LKLWLLRPIDFESAPWKPWYDKCFGVVVRAESEDVARRMAHEEHGYDLDGAWLAPQWSTCTELLPEGEPEIVICDVAKA
jgi:hypothetical protein